MSKRGPSFHDRPEAIDAISANDMVTSLKLSIVIPTKNRASELRTLLRGLVRQTTLPDEINVVDDSNNAETKELIKQEQADFLGKGIRLKYLRGDQKKKSISAARNIGTANSTGDIVCFLDDDVVLADDFLQEILRIYETYPDAKGVQGYITNFAPSRSTFSHALDRTLFCLPRLYCRPNTCNAFPFVYPFPVTRVIECEWAIGADSSYVKEVLKEFEFDESFVGYSLCEDIDLSYRIQKRYPGSVYMTPSARLVHKQSRAARISDERFAYILAAYPIYFFYKNIKQSVLNNIIFYWGFFVGRVIREIVIRNNPIGTMFVIGATVKVLRHFQGIRKGDL